MKKLILLEVETQEDADLVLNTLEQELSNLQVKYSVTDKPDLTKPRKDITGMSEGIGQ